MQGEKPVIYPILEWLLKNQDTLKKRAYLARYLVKVEVPAEFVAEEAIGELYHQVSYHTPPQRKKNKINKIKTRNAW